MTKIIRYCQEQWAGFWSASVDRPPTDTSYEEVSQEEIRRMNEHAKSGFATGNWVTESRES